MKNNIEVCFKRRFDVYEAAGNPPHPFYRDDGPSIVITPYVDGGGYRDGYIEAWGHDDIGRYGVQINRVKIIFYRKDNHFYTYLYDFNVKRLLEYDGENGGLA